MPRFVYKYCSIHKECEEYPGCGRENRRVRSAQVGENEATSVAIHPVTKEVIYCFNEDPTAPMPEAYAKEGFEKQQFHHYRDLKKFCDDNGLVNDMVEGYHKDDGYFEENLANRKKAEKEKVERYMEERDKVRKAMQ